MTMRNFDVCLAHCCPCFFSLMKEALYTSNRKKDTSVLSFDYISARYEKTFSTEKKLGNIVYMF